MKILFSCIAKPCPVEIMGQNFCESNNPDGEKLEFNLSIQKKKPKNLSLVRVF